MNNEPFSQEMDDTELNVWVDIYTQARIGECIDVPFSEFIKNPFTYLANAGQETALDCMSSGHLPLMPVQVATSQRINEEWSKKGSHLRLVSSN